MNLMQCEPNVNQKQQEVNTLKKYGLRWSILTAWMEDLSRRCILNQTDLFKKLESVRIKISSGCFSSCEVSSDLGEIEAELTSVDSSLKNNQTDRWIDLLGTAMDDKTPSMKLVNYPSVNYYYNDCQLRNCC